MNLQHVNIKLFLDGELSIDLEPVIYLFHRWVAEQSMEELLIDVADYRHVPQGPSVLLVGLEADYIFDNTGGRYGLVYNRKAPLDGSNEERFLQALRSAAHAAALLETEFSPLKFDRRSFLWSIRDRALAPQTAATVAACEPLLTGFVRNTLGLSDCQVTFDRDPRRLVSAEVTLPESLNFSDLATATV